MLADQTMLRSAACDLGLVVNSSTLVVTCEPVPGSGKFVIADWIELRPEPGAPLKPSEVARTFALCLRKHAIDRVLADGHYLESLREHLAPFRILVIPLPGGIEGKFEQFSYTRNVLHEGRLALPNDPRMLGQLRAVTSRANAGGSFTILQPKRRDGSHGDIVSALVGATWSVEYARTHQPQASRIDSEQLRRAFAGEEI
jgi:hypothetical protein